MILPQDLERSQLMTSASLNIRTEMCYGPSTNLELWMPCFYGEGLCGDITAL